MSGDIFISYTRRDKQVVRQIYDELKSAGYTPWLDVEDILPGENWRRAINEAIEKSDIFLAILSQNSVSKRGVIQKEILHALDKMDELLPEDLFIIPLRLDNCEIPERLKHLQVLDWDDGGGLQKLIETGRSLNQNDDLHISNLLKGHDFFEHVQMALEIVERQHSIFSSEESIYQDQCKNAIDEVAELYFLVENISALLSPTYYSLLLVTSFLTKIDEYRNCLVKFWNTCPPGNAELLKKITDHIASIRHSLNKIDDY